jgi:RimJ/RimL family protein N-acetyltransferase
MTIIAETERVILRELRESDAESVLAFNGDPRVMRYTGEEPWTDLSEARQRLRESPDYRLRGYGRWGVVYKPEGRVVGFNGLKFLEELGEVDIGFRLAYDYWGLGIATESSVAVLRYGFQELSMKRIIGLVLPENGRSVSVLEKLGMTRDGSVEYGGITAMRWALEVEDWKAP